MWLRVRGCNHGFGARAKPTKRAGLAMFLPGPPVELRINFFIDPGGAPRGSMPYLRKRMSGLNESLR